MDFLNKLGKKASETYQVTKEKTVKFSEEMKLKGKINETKSKITSIYKEVGELVYNNYKNNSEDANDKIKELCEQLSQKFDEVSKLEVELLALKQVKKCVNCGAEINQKDQFCSKCGKEQPKQEEPVEVTTEEEIKDVKEVEVKDIENNEKNEE